MKNPKRIVVDPLMLAAMNDKIPRIEAAIGVAVPSGIIVELDGFLPACTGYVEYSDGSIEKFGKWPEPIEDGPRSGPRENGV